MRGAEHADDKDGFLCLCRGWSLGVFAVRAAKKMCEAQHVLHEYREAVVRIKPSRVADGACVVPVWMHYLFRH